MDEELITLQKLIYFTEGNTFTGSRTKDWDKKIMLRYLVRPNKDENKLQAFSWTEDVNFETSKERSETEAPLTDEGIEEIRAWLLSQYEKL